MRTVCHELQALNKPASQRAFPNHARLNTRPFVALEKWWGPESEESGDECYWMVLLKAETTKSRRWMDQDMKTDTILFINIFFHHDSLLFTSSLAIGRVLQRLSGGIVVLAVWEVMPLTLWRTSKTNFYCSCFCVGLLWLFLLFKGLLQERGAVPAIDFEIGCLKWSLHTIMGASPSDSYNYYSKPPMVCHSIGRIGPHSDREGVVKRNKSRCWSGWQLLISIVKIKIIEYLFKGSASHH